MAKATLSLPRGRYQEREKVEIQLKNLEAPPEKEEEKPPPPPPPPKKVEPPKPPQQQFTPPVIKKDEEVKEPRKLKRSQLIPVLKQ
ncbi:hypothetical protein MASR1M65_12390 [Saprospiraceae bacterium]